MGPCLPNDAASSAEDPEALARIERLRICQAKTAVWRSTPSPTPSTEVPGPASSAEPPTQAQKQREERSTGRFHRTRSDLGNRTTS